MWRYRILYGIAALIALPGCSAVTSTTDVAADAGRTLAHGVSRVSRASSDASITEPDMPRYADAAAFADSQMAMLRREAAVGGGEHIDALALLLAIDDGDAMGRWMQRHYAAVFAAADDPKTLVSRVAEGAG